MKTTNKQKIVNDPIYGFVTINHNLIFDLIEHPYFQRLRRITQMGLSCLVYPGANHTRFHHALGCYHLMQTAVQKLRSKGVEISEEEEQGLYVAILLHDIGHGPFSHAMEHSIVEGISHEQISLLFMQKLNDEFHGQLSTAIQIFQKKYPKKFLNDLISSQLDIDRLDYLKRDSFYTGVAEGNINSERIIEMLNVKDDQLVVEFKGIYSVEKFLVARRLMYWLVYLHKTSLCAEQLLIKVLQRVKELTAQGQEVFASTALKFFINNKPTDKTMTDQALERFAQLDDNDIISGLKEWQHSPDFILSKLSKMLLNRDLLRVKLLKNPVDSEKIAQAKQRIAQEYGIEPNQADYFVFTGKVSNTAYNTQKQNIQILTKNRRVVDVAQESDQENLGALSQKVTKYYYCEPK